MAELDQYKAELQSLYIDQKGTLPTVMAHMEKVYGIKSSKAQYEGRFKAWGWKKNKKGDFWEIIGSKVHKRKAEDKKSVVSIQGEEIPAKKLNKEISRHCVKDVHPDYGNFGVPVPDPPTPDGVSIRTPPPFPNEVKSLVLPRKRFCSPSEPSREVSPGYEIVKRQKMTTSNEPQNGLQRLSRPQARVINIDLERLPYYQFKRFMKDKAVISRFRQIVTTEEGFLPIYWPQSASALDTEPFDLPKNGYAIDTFDYASEPMETTIFQAEYFHEPLRMYKPIAASVFINEVGGLKSRLGSDAMDYLGQTNCTLSGLLAKIPYKSQSELAAMSDLFSGPPTIESALALLEVAVYLSSNCLSTFDIERIIIWVIQNLPWAALRPFFATKLSTIQSFTEEFLRLAVRLAQVEIITDLLKDEAIKAGLRTSGCLLAEAVDHSNARVVEILLQAGANPRTPEGDGILPLHRAKSKETAMLLVKFGADVNVSWEPGHRGGVTALPMAVARGNLELVEYLISEGADVHGCHTLHEKFPSQEQNDLVWSMSLLVQVVAMASDEAGLLQLLLEGGLHNSIDKPSSVSLALSSPHLQRPQRRYLGHPCMDLMGGNFVYPYDVSTRVPLERTPLQMAARSGNSTCLKMLLEAGADVNAVAYGEYGETALLAAVSAGHIEIVRLLVQWRADVNALGNKDLATPRTALGAAAERGDLDLVNLLLQSGADPNAPSFGTYGTTPIEAAKAQLNCNNLVQALISYGAVDRLLDDKIALREAVRRGDLASVQALIQRGVPITMEAIQDHRVPGSDQETDSRTILHWALAESAEINWPMFAGDFPTVKQSSSRRINTELFRVLATAIDDMNSPRQEPLVEPIIFQAIASGDLEITKIVLRARRDLNITHDNWTPLQFAAAIQNLNAVKLLVEHGADINKIVLDNDVATTVLQAALCYCIRFELDIVYYLLHCGADVNGPIGINGRSALTRAVRIGDITIVNLLLSRKALPDLPPGTGGWQTPLEAAAQRGNLEILNLLLEADAHVNAPAKEPDGLTALQQAADCGHLVVLERLIEAGADVNIARSRDGCTAIQAAAESGHILIGKRLIEAGADVNALGGPMRMDVSQTALDFAAEMGRLDMVHLLLQAGADDYLPHEERYVYAASLARTKGNIVIAELLEGWESNEQQALAKRRLALSWLEELDKIWKEEGFQGRRNTMKRMKGL